MAYAIARHGAAKNAANHDLYATQQRCISQKSASNDPDPILLPSHDEQRTAADHASAVCYSSIFHFNQAVELRADLEATFLAIFLA